jgi:hypothetical protein
VSVFAPADKADSPRLPYLGTDPNAASAQDTVLIPEGIADFLDPTAKGDILNGAGVGGLGYQQLGQVAAQLPNPIRIGPDDHTLLCVKGAGGGDLGTAVFHMFDNAQPTGADIGKIGDMAQVRNTDSVFDGGVEDAGTPGGANGSPVYVKVDILQHLNTSFA